MQANTHIHTHMFLFICGQEFWPRRWLLSVFVFRFNDVSSHLSGKETLTQLGWCRIYLPCEVGGKAIEVKMENNSCKRSSHNEYTVVSSIVGVISMAEFDLIIRG
jgi:hypothetical protein